MEKIKVMRDWLQTEHNMFLPDEVHNIISEEVKNETYGVEDIALIIHRLSEMPWTTQEELINELNIDKEKLIELNEIIYNNDFMYSISCSWL